MSSTASDHPPAIFLMGPTASGKTDAAVALVERLPCEIVSVDSALVYRGMDIGTAKPGPEVLARAPHRLIDICDPADPYSAARFRADALREMAQVTAAGRVPLLVGGTMLYFKALSEGLAAMPAADAAVRARLDLEEQELGLAALHARLARVDPVSAARIHPNDPQRTKRALEVFEVSGRSLSSFIGEQGGDALPYRVARLIVAPAERAVLHERIERRFRQMLEEGFMAEVERLHARGDLNADLPAIRSVGYRQAWSHLEGLIGFDEMVERAIAATRQLAKRQFTWLRRETQARWFEAGERKVVDNLLDFAAKHLAR